MAANCAANPNPDNLLLVRLCQDWTEARKTVKWVKSPRSCSARNIQVWPVDANQMPRWIEQRLRAAQYQRQSRGGASSRRSRVEGNSAWRQYRKSKSSNYWPPEGAVDGTMPCPPWSPTARATMSLNLSTRSCSATPSPPPAHCAAWRMRARKCDPSALGGDHSRAADSGESQRAGGER